MLLHHCAYKVSFFPNIPSFSGICGFRNPMKFDILVLIMSSFQKQWRNCALRGSWFIWYQWCYGPWRMTSACITKHVCTLCFRFLIQFRYGAACTLRVTTCDFLAPNCQNFSSLSGGILATASCLDFWLLSKLQMAVMCWVGAPRPVSNYTVFTSDINDIDLTIPCDAIEPLGHCPDTKHVVAIVALW